MNEKNETPNKVSVPPSDSDSLLVNVNQDQIPGLTVGLYRAFLARGKSGTEAMLVYFHLLFTYRLQKTDRVFATNSYIRQGLHIGERRVKAAKGVLRSMGLIRAVQERKKGRIVKNYTRLNLLANPGPSRDIEEDFMAKGTAGAESAPPATGGAATARVDLKNKCLKNQSNKESCSNRSGRQSKKPPYLHNRIILQEIFRVARDGRG